MTLGIGNENRNWHMKSQMGNDATYWHMTSQMGTDMTVLQKAK